MNQEAVPADASDISDGPLPAYRRLASEGKLLSDQAQRLAAEKLQSLHNALGRGNGQRSWRERGRTRLRAWPARKPATPVRM